MPIGTQYPTEWTTHQDPATGRAIRQLTGGPANNYPLYDFILSITHQNDTLVFHGERSGWVQLHKLDLANGTITQLSDGHTRESGWAIWCESHLRGIYNHLSALNQAKREVYYFQDEEVRCTHLDTLENRQVSAIPGRIAIGQTGFSPVANSSPLSTPTAPISPRRSWIAWRSSTWISPLATSNGTSHTQHTFYSHTHSI